MYKVGLHGTFVLLSIFQNYLEIQVEGHGYFSMTNFKLYLSVFTTIPSSTSNVFSVLFTALAIGYSNLELMLRSAYLQENLLFR